MTYTIDDIYLLLQAMQADIQLISYVGGIIVFGLGLIFGCVLMSLFFGRLQN